MDSITIQNEILHRIGLGTWALRGRSCEKAVDLALKHGYRHVDTAEFYQNDEEIGRAISRSALGRDRLFITSKVWSNHLRYRDVLRACDQSLRKLRLEFLDLFLIHWPNASVPLEETLGAMDELIGEGKVRRIGVSNFSLPMLQEAIRVSEAPIFTNQVEYHVYRHQDRLQRYCQENDILLTAYSPLAKGRVRRDELLVRIGRSRGKSASQVALRWLIQQENVIAIPKSSREEHLQENLSIFDFELSPPEMDEIAGLVSF